MAGELTTTGLRRGLGIVDLDTGGGVLATVAPGSIIAAIGPSTVAGVSVGGGGTQYINSWPAKFAGLVRNEGVSATAANRFGCSSPVWSSLLANDSARVSSAGGWLERGNIVPGGNSFGATVAGEATFNFLENVNKFEVQWINNAAGRAFTYQIDGDTPVSVPTTGSFVITKTVINAGALGPHLLKLAWQAVSCNIISVEGYDDTSGMPVRVYNWGVSGATTPQLMGFTNAGADADDALVGRRAGYTYNAPDLSIIEGGLINDWRSSVPVAVSKQRITELVQHMKAVKGGTGKVLLKTPVFDNGSAGATASQEAYVTAMREVASEQSIKIIDTRAAFVSWAHANSQGWMSDDVHPSAAGYAFDAALVKRSIRIAA